MKPKILSFVPQEFWKIALSAVVGWGGLMYARNVVDPTAKIEWALGILTWLSTYLFFAQIKNNERHDKLVERLEELKSLNMQLIKNQSVVDKLASSFIDLQDFDPVLKATGFYAAKGSIDNFSVAAQPKKSVTMIGSDLSVDGYIFFWERLMEYIPTTAHKNIVVRITHSSDIGERYGAQSSSLNVLHQKFIEDKLGTVYRILIDRRSNDGDISEYISLMDEMHTHQVQCVYINTSQFRHIDGEHINNDFCIIDQINYSASWSPVGTMPKEVSMTQDESLVAENMNNWNALLRFVERYKYGKNPYEKKSLVFLEERRKDFLDSLLGPVVVGPKKRFFGSKKTAQSTRPIRRRP